MTRRGAVPLLAILLALPWGVALASPPPGFQETVVYNPIFSLTAFDWTPNGDLWIINKTGFVWVMPVGATVPTQVTRLTVDSTGERGLLGMAFDPDYAANGFLYLYYTAPTTPAHNRVSRFKIVGNTLQNETVLLQGPDLGTAFHNAGCVAIGTDGMLYASMGDNEDSNTPQSLDTMKGKLLRIARDGSIPPSNPFVSDPNARPEIYAYGFRNPWRFSVDPVTGNILVGDVGQSTWEELDRILPGANYGWPLTEGPQPPGVAGVTYPVFAYNHNGGNASITAGDFMRAGNFPSKYVGDYFYADYALNKLKHLVFDASGQPALDEDFVAPSPSLVHVKVGPDGALYYGSNGFETLWRLAWVGGTNSQPTAVATATPTSGLAPLAVQFNGTGSSDPDGTALSYSWAFGDGSFSSAASPSHTYASAGVYTAKLTVSDGQLTASATLRIVAGNRAPTATILTPSDGAHYDAGDLISFSGMGTDPEDGTLAGSAFTWTVLFHHQSHIHPYLGPFSGVSSGTFTITDQAETSPEVWYEILLDVTDSGSSLGSAGALTSRVSVNLYPNLSTMTLQTSPRPDLGLTLDGQPVTGPASVQSVVGMQRTLGAASPQTPGDGHTYLFSGWSDGGARSHTIATPAIDTTYTASFACDVLQEAADLRASFAAGQLSLTWQAPADICLAGSGEVYHIYEGSLARPSSPPGSFPSDPPFALRGGTSGTSFTFTPSAGLEFYLVVPVGSDGGEGPAGSYGS